MATSIAYINTHPMHTNTHSQKSSGPNFCHSSSETCWKLSAGSRCGWIFMNGASAGVRFQTPLCECERQSVCVKHASVCLCPHVGGKPATAQREKTKAIESERWKQKSKPTAGPGTAMNIHKVWSESQQIGWQLLAQQEGGIVSFIPIWLSHNITGHVQQLILSTYSSLHQSGDFKRGFLNQFMDIHGSSYAF